MLVPNDVHIVLGKTPFYYVIFGQFSMFDFCYNFVPKWAFLMQIHHRNSHFNHTRNEQATGKIMSMANTALPKLVIACYEYQNQPHLEKFGSRLPYRKTL
jgi:hypothetical protein